MFTEMRDKTRYIKTSQPPHSPYFTQYDFLALSKIEKFRRVSFENVEGHETKCAEEQALGILKAEFKMYFQKWEGS